MGGEVIEALARAWGVSALLLGLRIAPLLLLLPAALGERVPPLVRLALLLLLVAALTPAAGPTFGLAGGALWGAAARELVWGLGCGVMILAIYETLRLAGALAEAVAGRGDFGGSSPFGGAGGPLEHLHALLFAAAFLLAGGLTALIAALAGSLRLRPVGAPLSSDALSVLGYEAMAAVGGALGTAVAMVLPLWVATLLSDLGMGWMQRHLPELPIHFLSMPARSLAGWIVLALALGATLPWALTQLFDGLDALLYVAAALEEVP